MTDTDTAERITPAALTLYTNDTDNEVEHILLDDLRESPTNPRTHYDATALQELADTIKAVGVMQPILVRPISGAISYEIIFGHRRARAARLAGRETIIALVRTLTDAQCAQLQAIENVQRKDLTPLDEALGYAAYIAAHQVGKEQLAQDIGKSRTHVYNRLKLATLCPEGQQRMREGTLAAEIATLVARVEGGHTEQAKALKQLDKAQEHSPSEPISYRKARDLLKDGFTFDLKSAIFDLQDDTLHPSAGACTPCPKRSGNSPELYQDLLDVDHMRYTYQGKGSAHLCTDLACAATKKATHLAREARQLEAQGHTLITGKAAKAAIDPMWGNSKGLDLKPGFVKATPALAEQIKQLPFDQQPSLITIQDPDTGKVQTAYKAASLTQAAQTLPELLGGINVNETRQDQHAEQRKQNEAEATRLTTYYTELMHQVRAAAAGQPRGLVDLRQVCELAIQGVEYNARQRLAALWDCKHERDIKLGSMTAEQLTQLLLDCVIVRNTTVYSYQLERRPEALIEAAHHYGVLPGEYQPPADGGWM